MYITSCYLQSEPLAATSSSVSNVWKSAATIREEIEMAEFAYENQKGERKEPVSTSFAKFGANWPCFYGETAVGDLDTWKNRWNKFKDGWKYVCGLAYITEPCIVYSLGSSGNMAFEKDLLKKGEIE